MSDLDVKVTVVYSLAEENVTTPCRARLTAWLPKDDRGKLRANLKGEGCWGYGVFYDDNVVIVDAARAANWSELDDVVDKLIYDLHRTLQNNVGRNRSLKDSMPPMRNVYFVV
jgi:hypothetical protein